MTISNLHLVQVRQEIPIPNREIALRTGAYEMLHLTIAALNAG